MSDHSLPPGKYRLISLKNNQAKFESTVIARLEINDEENAIKKLNVR